MMVFLAFDFTNFIGRFHPLFVHLPIGFLVLALLMEWYQRRRSEQISQLVAYAWLLAGIGGAIAAFCGWWLGETGLYLDDDLFLHRWIGIAIVALSFVGWRLKREFNTHARSKHRIMNYLLLALLLFEGHLGGNLTHGAGYLVEYAPDSIKNLLVDSNEKQTDLSQSDSVQVYADLVRPIFEQKCFACHNNEVQRGDLNMFNIDSLQKGGQGGLLFETANALDSELFKRVTLPQQNTKFMPPVGNPLTYDEIKIIEWWISQGAPFDKKVSDIEVAEDLQPTLLRQYGLNTAPRPYYEMVSIAPLDSTIVDALSKKGFTINTLGANNALLDVKYSGDRLSLDQLKNLEAAAEHITWLSLARTDLNDEGLKVVSTFANLTRLQLQKTLITDEGIASIINLSHLEALNLYGTKVTNACLADIEKLKNLKRIYLWQTEVQKQEANRLEQTNPSLEVIFGEE